MSSTTLNIHPIINNTRGAIPISMSNEIHHTMCSVPNNPTSCGSLTQLFMECLQSDDIELLKRLLLNSNQLETLKQATFSIGSLDEYPLLHIACMNGSIEFVNIMLRFGFDPNQKTRKARQETVLFLMVRNFETILDETKSKTMMEMIQLLLDFDANPTLSDILLWKPIHMIQEKKIIKMLLKKGELIDSLGGTMQQTPLMLAARKGNCELVQWLLKHHANPNVSDKNGFFPIHHALGNETVVKLLLTIGKQDINKRADNSEGFTPLHFCCERETKGIHGKTNLLIMFNADPNVRSLQSNRTAEDVSENHKYLFKLYRSSKKELSLQKPIDSSHEAGIDEDHDHSEDEEDSHEVNVIMKEQFNKYMINYNYLDSVNEKRMSISHLIIYDYID